MTKLHLFIINWRWQTDRWTTFVSFDQSSSSFSGSFWKLCNLKHNNCIVTKATWREKRSSHWFCFSSIFISNIFRFLFRKVNKSVHGRSSNIVVHCKCVENLSSNDWFRMFFNVLAMVVDERAFIFWSTWFWTRFGKERENWTSLQLWNNFEINERKWSKVKFVWFFSTKKRKISIFFLFLKKQFEFVFVVVAEELHQLLKN